MRFVVPMSDHLVVFVDRLARPVPVDPVAQPPSEPSPPPAPVNADASGSSGTAPVEDCDGEGGGEEEPLIQMAECRICQEEDGVSNLETPCACSGSLKVSIFVSLMILIFFKIYLFEVWFC